MRCPTCPRIAGRLCLGERLPHLCPKPEYREYLAGYDVEASRPGSPGLIAMAGNLARATVAHVADGGRHASPEVQAQRKAICDACPNLIGGGDVCALCGCHLNIKRSWASSQCPDVPPRWEPV